MALDATALTSGAVTCATKPGAFGGMGLVLSLCEFRRADFGGWYGYCSMGFFGDGFPVMTLLNDCYCCWAKPLLYGVDPNTESALRLSLLSLLMISEL